VTGAGDDLLPLRGVRAALGVQRGEGLFDVARELSTCSRLIISFTSARMIETFWAFGGRV
jgi:hypothetical protein